jgi:hypothetical protein
MLVLQVLCGPWAHLHYPQERTYKRFFGLLAQRFCYIKKEYMVGGWVGGWVGGVRA